MKKKHLFVIITIAAVLLVIILAITNSCSKNGIQTVTTSKVEKKTPPFIVKPGPETPPPPEKPPAIARYKLADLYERGEDWVVKQFGPEYLKTCGVDWTVDDYNTVLENQARIDLEGIHSQITKPYAEITTEYFEKNYKQSQQIALDVRIMRDNTITYYQFHTLPYTLDDLVLDQVAMDAQVGDYILINIRTLTPFPPAEPIGGYFSGTAVNGIWVEPRLFNPDYWAKISTEIVRTGHVNIGTQITGLKKSVLFTVNR